MNVLELCDREIAAVPLEASVADAVHMMLDLHVGAVSVVDGERRVAGIFTERDVLQKLSLSGRSPASVPVREVMTTPVEMATLNTGAGEALATMVEQHYRHLPVVDDEGKLIDVEAFITQARRMTGEKSQPDIHSTFLDRRLNFSRGNFFDGKAHTGMSGRKHSEERWNEGTIEDRHDPEMEGTAHLAWLDA